MFKSTIFIRSLNRETHVGSVVASWYDKARVPRNASINFIRVALSVKNYSETIIFLHDRFSFDSNRGKKFQYRCSIEISPLLFYFTKAVKSWIVVTLISKLSGKNRMLHTSQFWESVADTCCQQHLRDPNALNRYWNLYHLLVMYG